MIKIKNKFKLYRPAAFAIFLIIALALTAFIFGNSLQTGEESGEASDAVTEIASEVLTRANIPHDPVKLGIFIRKDAHFTEFLLLSIAAFWACYFFNGRIKTALFSPIYCLAVAFADEFIMQRITAGRSPQLGDVMIDFAGALLACGVSALILRHRKKKQAKNTLDTER